MNLFRARFSAAARLFLGLVFLCPAAAAFAYDYEVLPAPALTPTADSGAAGPVSVPSAVEGRALYLAPFQDPRRDKDLWAGHTNFERVGVEAAGLDAQAGSWRRRDYGSLSFLWHRRFAQALAGRGVAVIEAPAPLDGLQAVSAAARAAGAGAVLGGRIVGLTIEKRGSDGLFGTDFSGTDYSFEIDLSLECAPLDSGRPDFSKAWNFVHVFHDSTPLGRRDRDTFPAYFAQGLSMAAEALAGDAALGTVLGLAPAAVRAVPRGAAGYWANPKTGKRMDASWNFDPADGTPRKDFVFVGGAPLSPTADGAPGTPSASSPVRP